MSYFTIILLCLMIIPLILIDSYANTNYTQKDIQDLNQQINDAEKKITELDDKIKEQYKTIKENEDNINEKKDYLKTIKNQSDDSWDSILDIIDAEKILEGNKNKLKTEQNQLTLLIQEKLDNIRLVDKLKEEINDLYLAGLEKRIGLSLSSECLQMIKNNITSSCPTYEELYILDSSIQNVSGKFGYKDGYFQRLNAPLINSWLWYDFDNSLRIFVDPPSGMKNQIKMILITPKLDTYILNGYEIQQQNRVLYHDRYIDRYCDLAIISSEKWMELLPDTLYHMRKNCEEGTTSFNPIELIPLPKTEIDITTSPFWQERQWFKESIIRCKQLC